MAKPPDPEFLKLASESIAKHAALFEREYLATFQVPAEMLSGKMLHVSTPRKSHDDLVDAIRYAMMGNRLGKDPKFGRHPFEDRGFPHTGPGAAVVDHERFTRHQDVSELVYTCRHCLGELRFTALEMRACWEPLDKHQCEPSEAAFQRFVLLSTSEERGPTLRIEAETFIDFANRMGREKGWDVAVRYDGPSGSGGTILITAPLAVHERFSMATVTLKFAQRYSDIYLQSCQIS